jgi:hypothetical protein
MRMASYLRGGLTLVVLSLTAAVSIGCGDDTGAQVKDEKRAPSALARCLQNAGARVATDVSELSFFFRARERGEASHPGFAYDKPLHAFVQEWRSVELDNTPPAWFLWAAEPFGQRRSIRNLVEDGPSRSYVAYIVTPTLAERKALKKCIDFDPPLPKNLKKTPAYDPRG